MNMFGRFLKVLAAMAVLMAAVASAPVLADDSSCVMAGLMGEEFGLCNAYCEAMDCDGGSPQASIKACAKVQAKFEAIAFDPVLPCLPGSGNALPTLDLNIGTDGTGATATFVSFGDAVPIAVDVEITDEDGSVITSATITLTDPLDGVEETLSLTPTGDSLVIADLLGTWNYDDTTFTLTITGDGTLALYEQILKEVVYNNLLDSPTTTATRTINVSVSDGTGVDSNMAETLMTVEVGCPCNTFSSPVAVGPDLDDRMYGQIFLNRRSGCDLNTTLCINGPSVFSCYRTEHIIVDGGSTTELFEIVQTDGVTRQWKFQNSAPDREVKACVFEQNPSISTGNVVFSGQLRVNDIRFADRPFQLTPSFTDDMLLVCAKQAASQMMLLIENFKKWQPDIEECAV